MRLNRLARPLTVAALLLLTVAIAGPALAKSSLGIGTAEVTMQPSGPFASLFVTINAYQREFFTALRKALVALKDGPQGLVFLTGLSFAYGVFHAAGPGHGKAVISSYVLANEVQLRRGIALSFVSSLLQAVAAIVVVGVAWFVLRGTSISMTNATNAMEIASYAMIVVFGAWLLVRKATAILSRRRRVFGLDFAAGGLNAPALAVAPAGGALSLAAADADGIAVNPLRPAGAHRLGAGMGADQGFKGPILRPASSGFAADVCVDDADDCDCGRSHVVDPKGLGRERLSLGSASSAVFAVGLRPCSGAIVVLTFALLNGLYLGGLLSVLAMALGTAITVSIIATLAVFAKDVALRFGKAGGMRRGVRDAVEILGAALVLLLGLALLGGALA